MSNFMMRTPKNCHKLVCIILIASRVQHIVDEQLVVPIVIRWNSTAALRNNLTYPATLNKVLEGTK